MGKIKDLSGQRFGKLTAIKANEIIKGNMIWNCICECGKEANIRNNALLTGKVKSYGCMRTENAKTAGKSRLKDLTGKRFGALLVIKKSSDSDCKDVYWECDVNELVVQLL